MLIWKTSASWNPRTRIQLARTNLFTNNILSIITWLPAVGAILIFALFKKEQNVLIKKFATAWLVLDFVVSLWLFGYNRSLGGMQFLEDHQWIPVIGARYQLGVDGVSVLLIVLTTFLGVLAALSSWNYIAKREKEYYILLLLLQTMVLGVFASMDLFLFYLFFEVSLVPMYFLIGIWGGENRLYAAIKFFLYTLVGSVVMLLGILKIYFLTQDTALTSKITQSTINLLWERQGRRNGGEHFAGGGHQSVRSNRDLQHSVFAGDRFSDAHGNDAGALIFRIRPWLCDQSTHVPIPYVAP